MRKIIKSSLISICTASALFATPNPQAVDANENAPEFIPSIECKDMTLPQSSDLTIPTLVMSGCNAAPVISEGTSKSVTMSEDSNPNAFNLTLNATDKEKDAITWAIERNASNGTASVSASSTGTSQTISYIPNPNFNGNDNFVVKVADETGSNTITVHVIVEAVDDKPVLEAISNITGKIEDGDDFNITLVSSDLDKDEISYTAQSSNSNIATVKIENGKLVVTPVANANGVITVEVNATANGQSAIQSFEVDIAAVNDTPTIDTTFEDLSILEDSGATNYELNVSDIEGSDLTITVESSDTSIMVVSSSWDMNSFVQQANWNSVPLDFNLTTVPNANGKVTIIVTVDDGELSSKKTFNVDVTAVNDAPVVEFLPDRIYYSDFEDKVIPFNASDIESLPTCSVVLAKENIIGSITMKDNNLTLTSLSGAYGDTNITLACSDGELNTSRTFNVLVLTITKDSDVREEPSPTVVQESQDGTVTSSNQIGDTLTIETKKNDTSGTVAHKITVGTQVVEASSQIKGSVVQPTATGVQTKYEDSNANLIAQADATVTGQASHTLIVNGVTTKATSQAVGATTIMSKDANGAVEIVTSVVVNGESISVRAKEDGTAEHSVGVNGIASKATSKVAGATTTIQADGKVETAALTTQADEITSTGKWVYEAVAKTDTTGKTVTTFQKRNTTTGEVTDAQSTFKPETPYNAGSSVVIEVINGQTYFKTTSSVTTAMSVE